MSSSDSAHDARDGSARIRPWWMAFIAWLFSTLLRSPPVESHYVRPHLWREAWQRLNRSAIVLVSFSLELPAALACAIMDFVGRYCPEPPDADRRSDAVDSGSSRTKSSMHTCPTDDGNTHRDMPGVTRPCQLRQQAITSFWGIPDLETVENGSFSSESLSRRSAPVAAALGNGALPLCEIQDLLDWRQNLKDAMQGGDSILQCLLQGEEFMPQLVSYVAAPAYVTVILVTSSF